MGFILYNEMLLILIDYTTTRRNRYRIKLHLNLTCFFQGIVFIVCFIE